MARYYRKYYRKSWFKKPGSWSSRIENFSGAQSAAPNERYIIAQTLCTNPGQSSTTVSNKYTVKNINCQLQLMGPSNNYLIENLQVFVMFVPQGYLDSEYDAKYAQLPYDHPEWIMSHRYFGTANPNSPAFAPLRLSSRLARKLDTGDRIVLIILGTNTNSGTGSITLDYEGVVKYVTKSN